MVWAVELLDAIIVTTTAAAATIPMEDIREKLLYDYQLLVNNKNINIKQRYKKSPALFKVRVFDMRCSEWIGDETDNTPDN